ncbi:Ribonuclease HII [Popillia japonica]|uniref:Ribonuclease n=1 Tax=Popillia japonica TaxID=7064 RepID=A0AAW1MSK7_POPJA
MENNSVKEEEIQHISNLKTLKQYLCHQDNSENAFYFSNVPQKCKEFPCMLGIDEAGRGPVLGPMVYGTALCCVDDSAQLAALECADSKALTEETRDKLFEKICGSPDLLGWGVEIISPNSICNSMLSRTKYSLNQVSMDSAIGLIRGAVKAGVNIEHIYVDTVGPPEKYQAYLLSLFPNFKITVAKKADSTYSIVSAASICAKVVRDHALSVWDFQEFTSSVKESMEKFGSGYPGG